MRIFFDPRVERATLKLAMGAALRTALQLRFNVRARVFDTSVADDWTPPLRMGLDDFHPSIAGIFHGGGDREREAEQAKRLAAALSSFDNYLKNIKADSGPCTHLLQITQEIANGPASITLLVLGDKTCSGPRIRFQVPHDRKLVIMLAPGTGTSEENNECALAQQEKRIGMSFPHVAIVPVVGAETLTEIVSKGSSNVVSAGLTIHPCGTQMTHRRNREVANAQPTVGDIDEPENGPVTSNTTLRIISPRQGAHVSRYVPFQGDGATPGEMLCPVVRVNDEYWANPCIQATNDGSFSGVVIAGRPFSDCGVMYEFRVLGRLQEPLSVGHPSGAWPSAQESSLSLDVVRASECEANTAQQR